MLGGCLPASVGKLKQGEVALTALLDTGEGAVGGTNKHGNKPYHIHYASPCPHDGMAAQITHHLVGGAHTRVQRVENEK